jgi:hypothetical protein
MSFPHELNVPAWDQSGAWREGIRRRNFDPLRRTQKNGPAVEVGP